jgi:hypothetical protein
VRKKTITALVIAGLLLSLVGMQFVEVTEANPFGPAIYSLKVTINYPANGTIFYASTVKVVFSAVLELRGSIYSENLVRVYLDNKEEETLFYLPSSYTVTFKNLTGGQHHLEVTAYANAHWVLGGHPGDIQESDSSVIDFTVQLPNLQPSQNSTIATSEPTPAITQTPTPTLSHSPTPSPTLSPTLQPTLTSTLHTFSNFNIPEFAILGLAIFVAIIFICVIILLRKKK